MRQMRHSSGWRKHTSRGRVGWMGSEAIRRSISCVLTHATAHFSNGCVFRSETCGFQMPQGPRPFRSRSLLDLRLTRASVQRQAPFHAVACLRGGGVLPCREFSLLPENGVIGNAALGKRLLAIDVVFTGVAT